MICRKMFKDGLTLTCSAFRFPCGDQSCVQDFQFHVLKFCRFQSASSKVSSLFILNLCELVSEEWRPASGLLTRTSRKILFSFVILLPQYSVVGMAPSISTSSQVFAQPSSEMRRGSRINLTRVLSSFVKFCSNVFFSAMVTDIFMIFNISGDGSMSRFSVIRKFTFSTFYRYPISPP